MVATCAEEGFCPLNATMDFGNQDRIFGNGTTYGLEVTAHTLMTAVSIRPLP